MRKAKPIMLPISSLLDDDGQPQPGTAGMAGGGGRAGASAMVMARPATRRMRAGSAALLKTGAVASRAENARQRKEEKRQPGVELGRVDRNHLQRELA
jgi:hypothetical protein